MKKILYILVLFPMIIVGQTTSENYIKTTVYKKPTSQGSVSTENPEEAAIQVTYFDGLGRPIQKIAYKQSGNGKDLVTHIEYDDFGRQAIEYLPIENDQTLNYHSIDAGAVYSYYSAPVYPGMEVTGYPFSEKLFETSPLNRVLKQSAPGDDWKMGGGHEVGFDYQTNQEHEVRLFTVGSSGSFMDNNMFYNVHTLYKTITKNENWISGKNNTTEEFKDNEGHVVLKRTYNQEPHDTYYVYDDYGNLAYVIPPLVDLNQPLSNSVLDGLCYQYRYDYRNRLIEKKLPGKQWEFIAYNSQDMPVATGPVQSPWGADEWGWLITKYDIFGRVVYTAWSRAEVNHVHRELIEASLVSNWYEAYSAQTISIDGIMVNYTNATSPNGIKLLTVNYYDNYNYANAPTLPTSVESEPVLTNVKSLATGTWVRILDDPSSNTGELSYTLYDSKARAIRTHKDLFTEGFTQTDSKLDFTGKAKYTVTTHKRKSSDALLTVLDTYTYSPQDRLEIHTQQINNLPVETIVKNAYTDLGQLIRKDLGTDPVNFTPLQREDFKYNVRGWLTGINDIGNLTVGSDPEDFFAFRINYNEDTLTPQSLPATKLYNGNIAETYWRSSTDDVLRNYNYSYDHLNRLTTAVYQKPDNAVAPTNMYNENMSYDKNGNIQHMQRNGDYDSDVYGAIEIDNLDYVYDTGKKNQLMIVTDNSNSPKGFKDDTLGNREGNYDYDYDANGNMIRDDNKGITGITYNHLNLPVEIMFGTGDKIKYLYDAVGKKVTKTVTAGATEVATDYLDGYQYTDGLLNFFPHAEGYVNVTYCPACQTQFQYRFNYVYQYKDHLGNIRVSFGYDQKAEALKIIEENHYYPFGLKHTKYNTGKNKYEPDEEFPELMKLKQLAPGETVLNKYKFLGQERQDELGLNWDSFRHRNYDYAIGRFMGIDPISEDYFSISTYQFAHNNPVWKIEIEGLEGQPTVGFDIINNEPIQIAKYTSGNMTVTVSVDSGLANRGLSNGPGLIFQPNDNSQGGMYNSIGLQQEQGSGLVTYRPLFDPPQGLCSIEPTNELLMAHDAYQIQDMAVGIFGVAGAGKKLIQETLENVSKNGPEAVSNLKGILKSAQNSVKGLDDQISSHSKKLEEYLANPDAFDNKGFLKNASPELREKIINSRVESLKSQIQNFQNQKEEITNGVQQLLESINK